MAVWGDSSPTPERPQPGRRTTAGIEPPVEPADRPTDDRRRSASCELASCHLLGSTALVGPLSLRNTPSSGVMNRPGGGFQSPPHAALSGGRLTVKALWVAVGTVWFAGWTICSYRVFASSAPIPVLVESESRRPPPDRAPSAVSAPVPRRTFTPEELFAGPQSRAVPARKVVRPSPSPLPTRHTPRPATAVPPPARSAPPISGQTIPSSEPDPDLALCLVCKEPAYSWVERDGRRYGYCLQHQRGPSDVKLGAGTSKEARAQCLGTTKAGTRCRRKASRADGYCYQHKPL